ncbi:hypothetical protein BAY59_31310 [Prauserella coralliicola]|uniref:Uncharacterized protein n=1 Tax=Prauserella endophytica TaxID=1592324 RepID=A0ABY2S1V6_9PSEU|nr:hypothetical protein BAY59_31310 [Prauserella coralliicola]TKG67058.1 hypothetical protein FCN18_23755 [Prauserella endophytica]
MTGTAATAEDTFTLEGTITLSTDGADLQLNDDGSWYCIGANGYDDIAEGTRVTVYDPSGAVLATGALGQGGDSVEPCVLPIAVPDVPGGHDTYQVEVSDRGKIVVSATEAKAGQVALTLD